MNGRLKSGNRLGRRLCEDSEDATGLPRGVFHAWCYVTTGLWGQGCHGLAPWRLHARLLSAEQPCRQASCYVNLHGASPWHLTSRVQFSFSSHVNLHGASPWHLTSRVQFFLAAT